MGSELKYGLQVQLHELQKDCNWTGTGLQPTGTAVAVTAISDFDQLQFDHFWNFL